MRLAFAGTPAFAAVALTAIVDAGFDVAVVLTQPDRPAGRGLRLQPSEVKRVALAHQIPVVQPTSLKLAGPDAPGAEACRNAIADARVDAMVVAAYGLLLPRWVLQDLGSPHAGGRRRHGCINIHGSLLPRWRGAAPIHRAIEAGDRLTGVCIMQMDEGLDTGAVIRSAALEIRHEPPDADTTSSLHDRLASLGAKLIVEVLRDAERGPLDSQPQAADGVTYARKVDRQEARIRWTGTATEIDRKVRAFHPAPGAWTDLDGQVVKVWQARTAGHAAPPAAAAGEVLSVGARGIEVATGDGVLLLSELQRAGGRRLGALEFANGLGLQPGMRLGDGEGA